MLAKNSLFKFMPIASNFNPQHVTMILLQLFICYKNQEDREKNLRTCFAVYNYLFFVDKCTSFVKIYFVMSAVFICWMFFLPIRMLYIFFDFDLYKVA